MKKLFLLLLIMAFMTGLIANETLTFTIGEWTPYSSQSLDGYGIIPRIVTAAYAEVGIDVKLEWMPWKRALEIIKTSNAYDGSLGWTATEEREEFYYFSEEPIVRDKQVMFHRKDYEFKWDSFEDLKNLKIGHTSGYAVLGDLKKAEDAGLKLDIGNSDVINFRKLIYGRIDLFDCNFAVGYDLLAKNFEEADRLKITNSPKVLSESSLHVTVSKDNPKARMITEKYDEGLRIIRANGKLDEILKMK